MALMSPKTRSPVNDFSCVLCSNYHEISQMHKKQDKGSTINTNSISTLLSSGRSSTPINPFYHVTNTSNPHEIEQSCYQRSSIFQLSNCDSFLMENVDDNDALNDSIFTKKMNLLLHHIRMNDEVIEKVKQIVNKKNRKMKRFIGSSIHLELESIYVMSQLRRQELCLLKQNFVTDLNDDVNKYGTINVQNIRYYFSNNFNAQQTSQEFYFCLLQHREIIYNTASEARGKEKFAELGGNFTFTPVGSDFQLIAHIYMVEIKENQSCFPFSKSIRKVPLAQLVGKTEMNIQNISFNELIVVNNSGNPEIGKLTFSIDISINWPITKKGFLTMGLYKEDHFPKWHERWCILEQNLFKYYTDPNQEYLAENQPVGVIDLKSCKICTVMKKKYCGRMTLVLEMDEFTEYRNICFRAVSPEDLKSWQFHFQTVLKIIDDWQPILKPKKEMFN